MFKLEIETDNDVFRGNKAEAVARVLQDVAVSLEQGATEGKIRDVNGNTIGKFALTRD